LHVPLDASTHKLIGARELGLMKPTAIVINTCRGPVVNKDALYDALVSERMRGAGLDVMVEEPPAPEHKLFTLHNIILAPHLAGRAGRTGRRRSATRSTTSSASPAARSRSGPSPNCGAQASYSITSSAVASGKGDMVRPTASALLRSVTGSRRFICQPFGISVCKTSAPG